MAAAGLSDQLRGWVRDLLGVALRGAAGGGAEALAADLESALSRACGTDVVRFRDLYEVLEARADLPRGEFLETTLARDFASGAINAAGLVAEASAALPPVDPRTLTRAMFHRLLAGARLAGGAPLDRRDFALGLERGCYNEVIRQCQDAAVVCQWNVPRFRELYGSRCGRVAANLDPDGSAARSTGGKSYLMQQLCSESWRPELVGALENDELCPSAHRADKDIIRKRLGQRVRVRRTHLFTCPKCKARDSSFTITQTRSLDEAGTIFCICRCGHRFTG